MVDWPSDPEAAVDEERTTTNARDASSHTQAEDPYYEAAVATEDAWRCLQTETGFDPKDYDPDAIVPRVQAFLFRWWSNDAHQRLA